MNRACKGHKLVAYHIDRYDLSEFAPVLQFLVVRLEADESLFFLSPR